MKFRNKTSTHYNLLSFVSRRYITWNRMRDDEERIWKAAVVRVVRYCPSIYVERISDTIACVPAEVRTQHLPNTNPECYRCPISPNKPGESAVLLLSLTVSYIDFNA